MTATKVLIDGTAITGEAGLAGIGRYVANLVDALAARDDVDLSVLTLDERSVPVGARAVPVRRRWRARRRAHYEHEWRLALDVRRAPPGIVHTPAVDAPRRLGRRWVQTLHDVIPLVADDADLAGERQLWRRWAGRYRRADAVIAVSRFSADEGINVLGLDPRRVHVVHHGVGAEFAPAGPVVARPRPYVLTVSEYSRRKRFDHAFAAIGLLADEGLPHELVVAGRFRPHNADELRALAAGASHPDRVELLGYVVDLAALYRGADAVVITSSYEGFGLPALEAMACGTPVVAYDNTALPEVIGDAGVLVPDGDVEALAKALRAVVNEPSRRAELVAAGTARAAAFTWARTAEQTAAVYRTVAR